ncbi:PREDICTED: uncharacterized protein LOC104755369 isoform X2 [Camelina sativa]|uniref:Uncharacterized protein LOC104755369 isoform X2 n=1 Tax=Camelina sativa TaxID=90675 RepID=A0ABM0WTR7_CAMSA|nr:PREDICTED: uncharacterized protein LOC104755369 isoform X2 [Camelina sativa]
MMKMKEATQEESVTATSVLWDINRCPLPDGCAPRLVRPSIKRLLENHGYHGDVTVTAFGDLSGVPVDFLREVFSSGINLNVVTLHHLNILDLIDTDDIDPPPTNFMVLSPRKECGRLSDLLKLYGHNPLQPFPFESFESIIMEDSEEETGGSALWDCLICACDPPGQIFENLIAHLSDEEHHHYFRHEMATRWMPPDPDDDAAVVHSPANAMLTNYAPPPPHVIDWEVAKVVGETVVFWDINSCPVPLGFDASLVGLCIKRFLRKEGYSGHVTIEAIGVLADVPNDTLEKVYSGGITLHNVPYGPSDTVKLVFERSNRPGPLCNIMVISNAKIFAWESKSQTLRCNLLKPFPIDSIQRFCVAESVEEDQCSETGESAFLICSLCNYHSLPFHRFGSFAMHLNSRRHQQKLSELLPISKQLQCLSAPLSESPEKDLGAVTSVFWDINMCPVPPGCVPRRVGPCIKQFLENKGYSGPLTITAIGVLTDVPNDILEGVYSSGISLNNIASGFFATVDRLICEFTVENPPPANLMVISDAKSFTSDDAFSLESRGYNILQPVPCDSLERFFLAASEALEEEDKCSETSESAFWICSVCDDLRGQGFGSFTTHVTSWSHKRKLLDWLPGNARFLRKECAPNLGDQATSESGIRSSRET